MEDVQKTIKNANDAINKLTNLVTEEQDENIKLNNRISNIKVKHNELIDSVAADYSKLNARYVELKRKVLSINRYLDAGEPGRAEVLTKQTVEGF